MAKRICYGLAILSWAVGACFLLNGEPQAALILAALGMFALVAGAIGELGERIKQIEDYLKHIKRMEGYLKQRFPFSNDADQPKDGGGKDEGKEDIAN